MWGLRFGWRFAWLTAADPMRRSSKELRHWSHSTGWKCFAEQFSTAMNFCLSNESGEQLRVGFGFDEFARLFEMVVNDGFRIDSESVVHRGQEFRRMDGIVGGATAGFI